MQGLKCCCVGCLSLPLHMLPPGPRSKHAEASHAEVGLWDRTTLPEQDTEGSALGQFEVGKRVSLYLARVCPAQAIDHLAYEAAQLIHQEDDPLPPAAARLGPPKVPPFALN